MPRVKQNLSPHGVPAIPVIYVKPLTSTNSY
uniref:Uncharacterized protein n=1 Tax=Anguilla anguilla TaxID=7936 RepID=A0A0E9V4V5_ANGAN